MGRKKHVLIYIKSIFHRVIIKYKLCAIRILMLIMLNNFIKYCKTGVMHHIFYVAAHWILFCEI